MNALKAITLQLTALFVIGIMMALPASAATQFGSRYCYKQGSLFYCARYDGTSFNSGSCAGYVSGPHINFEVLRNYGGVPGGKIANWHVGWKTVNGQSCLVAYEPSIYSRSHSAGCYKICYDKKSSAQGGDVLAKMGFPSAMKYDSQISNVLRRLYIGSGTSPYQYYIRTAAGTIVIAAHSLAIMAVVSTVVYSLLSHGVM